VNRFLKLKDLVIHVHIHDNHGERDEHLPVGFGTVPWDRVAAAFEGYSGRMVTESRSLTEGQRSLKRLKKLMKKE
jgi:sugar phosphate isomerase/epimerase